MSKQLDLYEVRVLPWNYAGEHLGIEKIYELTVSVNGEKLGQSQMVPANIPPHMNEFEFLNRLTQSVIRKLQEEDNGDKRIS